jgi:hypothetical protein
MGNLMRFPNSAKREPVIEVWMEEHCGELGGDRAALVRSRVAGR